MDREFDARAYDQGYRDGRNEAAAEIGRLRTALRLIAEHPVEQSKQWEVGAREMLKLARTTLEHPHDR